VGFLDALLGRSKPVKADLDDLFSLPSAAVTLEVSLGLHPTGSGAVCFKPVEGAAFERVESDIAGLLPTVERHRDEFGYLWLVCRGDTVADVVTDLHAVNSSLEEAGFGPSLLCTLVSFTGSDGRRLALVYLYKRGTCYPFAPLPGQQRRDNALELSVRSALGAALKIEPDLSRWFPVWGAPGL
jgi:hypothetical protein